MEVFVMFVGESILAAHTSFGIGLLALGLGCVSRSLVACAIAVSISLGNCGVLLFGLYCMFTVYD
jgi:hypothetical protein